MAKLLLIETATEVCSAAIAVNGAVVSLAEDVEQPNHAARLTLLIEQCVSESGILLHDLDAVAVSRGPGSYTSLRVGASVAKGICYALDKPLIAISTLQALAAGGAKFGVRSSPGPELHPGVPEPNSELFIPMLDARRQEVWTAVYDTALNEVLPPQALILEHNLFGEFLRATRMTRPTDRFVVLGNGGIKLKNVPDGENVEWGSVKFCSAKYLAGLAERLFQSNDFEEVAYFEPFYMKMPNITVPKKTL